MTNSIISVIIPVYNSSEYLRRCVESILNQTYKDFEIILVDDGSKDSSYDICKEYSTNYSQIKSYTKKNTGASDTRAYGVKHAFGSWICFVDSDDELPANALFDLYNKAEQTKADIILGGWYRILKNGNKKKKNLFVSGVITSELYIKSLLSLRCYAGPVGKLISRKLFDNHTFEMDSSINHNEDLIMNIHLAVNAKNIAIFPNLEVYWYYENEGSMTSQISHIDMWDKVMDELDECLGEKYRLIIDYYMMIILYKLHCDNLLDKFIPSNFHNRILSDFSDFNFGSSSYFYALYFLRQNKFLKFPILLCRLYRKIKYTFYHSK